MRCPFCFSTIEGSFDSKIKVVKCSNCETVFPSNTLNHPHSFSTGNHSNYLCGDPSPNPIRIATIEGV